MCGLSGFLDPVAYLPASQWQPVLARMGQSIAFRGPDDSGEWLDPDAGIGLSHRRLSILDLSAAGHQPMVSSSGRFVIALNGEIYNHLELREQLGTFDWRGHSDTETLLRAFERWGITNALKRAVGMFAIAVWDRDERSLWLVRDRFGEKPLYYGWQGGVFLFGSVLRALKQHPAFRGEVDRESLASYLRYSYVPAPRSIYQGIHKLPAGTVMRLRTGDPKPTLESYWSLKDVAHAGQEQPFTGSDAEAIATLDAKLSQAVLLQQISDVPLGAFLSGGIDSSTVVALMQRQARVPVRTFTIGFRERDYNEADKAREVARHLGTNHTELYVTAQETQAVIPRLAELYDEPFADASQIPTFLVAELARRHVTVSLSGDAGDELFGGYNRYVWAARILKRPALLRQLASKALTALSPAAWDWIVGTVSPLLPASMHLAFAGDRAHKLAAVLNAQSARDIYFGLLESSPKSSSVVRGVASTTAESHEPWPTFARFEHSMMALDAVTYLTDDILVKVDRAAMGVSLETRVPFLDHRVVELAWQLPLHMKIRNGCSKWILRQLLYKYVPQKLVDRPKSGFAVPIGSWLRGPLRSWAEDLLDESRLRREGFFEPAPIRQKWMEHLSGQRNWQQYLWNVVMYQAWLKAQ